MGLSPAQKLHFDGTTPWANGAGTNNPANPYMDEAGVIHVHKIKQGSDAELELDFSSSGVNVINYNFKAQFKLTYGATSQADASFTYAPGGNTSRLRVKLPAGITEGMDPQGGVWDLEATAVQGGAKDRWVEGTWAITREVTTI